MRSILLLAAMTLSASAAAATCPPEAPEGSTCGSFSGVWVMPPSAVEPPPVEPPPIDPPPVEPPIEPPEPGVGREHWEAVCFDEAGAKNPGIIECNAYDSVASVAGASKTGAGVPNTPGEPRRNGSCGWNGGGDPAGSGRCFPTFWGLSDSPPAPDDTTADCLLYDQLLADGRQRQPEGVPANEAERLAMIVEGSLWAPCYDAPMKAARFHFPGNIGSSKQNMAIEVGIPGPEGPQTVFALSAEFTFHESFYQTPAGSTTSKLWRVSRVKSAECSDTRLMDGRITLISPDLVRLNHVVYCRGEYGGSGGNFDIPIALAGVPLRITWILDIPGRRVTTYVVNAETGEHLLMSESPEIGVRDLIPGSVRLHEEMVIDDYNWKGIGFQFHASSSKPDPGNAWMPYIHIRHAIAAVVPIAP